MAKPLLSLDPEGGAKSSGGLPGSMTPKPAAAMAPEAGLKAPAAHFGNATRTFRLAAERIAFALTVHEVDWQRARKLVAEPIEFTATVQDATLRPQLADEIIMAAEPVAFTATVQDVALRHHHVLKAGAISYSTAVQDVQTAVETPTPTPTTIFEASFTVESDTNLSNYTPDIGNGFSIETFKFGTPDPQELFAFAATDTASTETGGARGSAGTMAIADPGPSSANYYVEIDVITERDGGDDPLILILQWQDEDNWYGARIYDDSCQIFKVVNGSAAQLDSANVGVSNGDTVKFETEGTTKRLYINDSEVASAQDSDIADPGQGGWGVGATPLDDGDDTDDWIVDNFKVVEVASSGDSGEFVTTPEAHGWSDQNTVAQNTAAFNAAIEDASENAGSGRGVVELAQSKTYTVNTTNGSANDQNAALALLSNVEIRTTGKPTRSSGDQATIQFESWSGKSGVHNQALARIDSGVDNVLLGWLTLHGNKNTLDDETDVNYSQGQDGGIHNVVIYGGTNITFREVLSAHAVNDALYIRVDADPALLIEDCTFTRCRRQGISITRLGTSGAGIDQMVCRRLLVSDIGDFSGDIGGQRPGAGIDIEPNSDSHEIHGLTIDDCDFEGVLGSTWHHGVNDGGQSDGAGILGQSRANMSNLRIINTRCTGCRRGLVLKASGSSPVHSDVLIEDAVITDSTNDDSIRLESAGADGGTLVNWSIINPKIGSAGNGAVTVEATLAASGHSVDIWKGDFDATLSNPGNLTTFTLHEGFPQTFALLGEPELFEEALAV